MPAKTLRLVIDTNLWVSFLITRNYHKLDKIIVNHQAQLLFSKELLAEFIDVVNRPKLKKYFSKKDVEILLHSLEKNLHLIEVSSTVKLCRDPKDNFLLALAKDGKADYLITGDNDLLVLKKIGTTRIISITEFLSEN